ncbi:hypothetical protein CY34DRAFT_92718, partial [Suillus luteus UH-Slu-Lm8-n1]
EVNAYLTADLEHVPDVLAWWHEHRNTYLRLSRMALDYLTIPTISEDVEHIFSRGCLLLSYICSRLSSQSIYALLCLGCWSHIGLVKDKDMLAVAVLADVEGDEDALADGWDDIQL